MRMPSAVHSILYTVSQALDLSYIEGTTAWVPGNIKSLSVKNAEKSKFMVSQGGKWGERDKLGGINQGKLGELTNTH